MQQAEYTDAAGSEHLDQVKVQTLLTLYTSTNSYILQYRDFAFRMAVYTVGLLGACIGLALNDRFKSLWSDKTRGFLLAVLLLFSIVATMFICVLNHKSFVYKQRRAILEELLGYCSPGLHKNVQPLISTTPPAGFGVKWRYALAFCFLIAITTIIAMTAFSR